MKYSRLFFLFLVISIATKSQEIIEEDIQLFNGSVNLAGTLSYPEKDSVPLTIFIHGSGNIDRNGNQAGMPVKPNYIKLLADSLNKNGIAFYRYDKRTANPKNLALINESIRFEDLVQDAEVVMRHFQSDLRFSSIVIIGHSQGSLTAMLALNDSISKFVSLAGASRKFGEILVSQISKQNKELGNIARSHLEELQATDTIKEVNFMLQQLFNPVNHNFIKSYNTYDPIEEINKIKIPVLVIHGNADLQITTEDALGLKDANLNSELVIIPEMNHVLKTIKNVQENYLSYQSEAFPLSTQLVKVLTEFIKKE
jgi:pimeloyl-ACP methyl ester carboxylesterase